MANSKNVSLDIRAKELLEKCGFHKIPIPVERIAKSLGAQVRYSPLDEELSGMVFIKDGIPIIGVNSLHHPNRQRFTIAHEIAHMYLHRDFITSSVHVDKQFSEPGLKRDAESAKGADRLEIEANQFGAALLMPKDILEDMLSEMSLDIEDEDSLEALAKKFKVSKATLQYRIRNLLTE
jgi:Zn-dependent peptidase ImmA (M78 family)